MEMGRQAMIAVRPETKAKLDTMAGGRSMAELIDQLTDGLPLETRLEKLELSQKLNLLKGDLQVDTLTRLASKEQEHFDFTMSVIKDNNKSLLPTILEIESNIQRLVGAVLALDDRMSVVEKKDVHK
jgi:hypothetical protein